MNVLKGIGIAILVILALIGALFIFAFIACMSISRQMHMH